MTASDNSHARIVDDQFSRQAAGFASSVALHADGVVALVVEAAAASAADRCIDLACGPGSVACGLAAHAHAVVGLDATGAMLDQARKLAAKRGLANVEWRQGSVYAAPFDAGAFDAATCRFAFHHFEHPPAAFAEMARLVRPGGRIVVCDGLASDDPARARAFNDMEKLRDPSTVAFRTFGYLRDLFVDAGLGEPQARFFHVTYRAADLARGSFPEEIDRAALQALLENSVEGDTLGMEARRGPDGVTLSYRSVVLSAVKPAV